MYEHHCLRLWYCSIYFLLDYEIERYHCHKFEFAYFNTCNLIFSPLKLENGLQKHVPIHTKSIANVSRGRGILEVVLSGGQMTNMLGLEHRRKLWLYCVFIPSGFQTKEFFGQGYEKP